MCSVFVFQGFLQILYRRHSSGVRIPRGYKNTCRRPGAGLSTAKLPIGAEYPRVMRMGWDPTSKTRPGMSAGYSVNIGRLTTTIYKNGHYNSTVACYAVLCVYGVALS